jgi:hypothetical protein
MTPTEIITLAESQEELREMHDIRKAFEAIPAYRREEVCRELIKHFPNVEIRVNGEVLKP